VRFDAHRIAVQLMGAESRNSDNQISWIISRLALESGLRADLKFSLRALYKCG